METQIETDFNSIQFEKKLTALKDTQESIQQMSAWCLQNRQHHKKIVNSWLNVLKRVKVEHRLTLFYLANDVIQYSKRKNYEFVDSWGTTLQKATTMVRDEKVRHRILRIFKIWEQRAVYGEDFIGDLSGLLSAAAGKTKTDDPTEFQTTSLFSRLRQCATLEADTDAKLKTITDNPLSELDVLCNMLKDRRQVVDVEQRIETDASNAEAYVKALQSELRARGHLIALLEQAEKFYIAQRGEVKVVANAYRNFGTRVKNLKRKLDELKPTLASPVPSPDINAPSPSPDSDLDLPGDVTDNSVSAPYSLDQSYNTSITNGFSSFMGGGMPFDLSETSLFEQSSMKDCDNVDKSGKPIEVINQNIRSTSDENFNISEFLKSLLPGQPAEMSSGQILNKSHTTSPEANAMLPSIPDYNPQRALLEYNLNLPNITGSEHTNKISTDYNAQQNLDSMISENKSTVDYSGTPVVAPLLPPPMPPMMMEGPEGNTDYGQSYADDISWNNWNIEDQQQIETPESPPCYEREGCISQPVMEYNDRSHGQVGAGVDVDHRVVPLPPPPNMLPQLNLGQDVDHRMKDIDHRNLISLTGSPHQKQADPEPSMIQPLQPPHIPAWTDNQAYNEQDSDQDYRIPPLPPAIGPYTNSPEKFLANPSLGVMQGPPIRGLNMQSGHNQDPSMHNIQMQPPSIHSPLIAPVQRLNGMRFPSRPPPPPPGPPPISSPTSCRPFRSPNRNTRPPLLETPMAHHKTGFGNIEGPRIRFHSSVRHANIPESRISNVKEIIPMMSDDSKPATTQNTNLSQEARESTQNENESTKNINKNDTEKPIDNVESIDMEMSDEENESGQHREHSSPEKISRMQVNNRETVNNSSTRQDVPAENQRAIPRDAHESSPQLHRNRPQFPPRLNPQMEDFTEEVDFQQDHNIDFHTQFSENEFENRVQFHSAGRYFPPPRFQGNFRGRGGVRAPMKMRPPFMSNPPNRGQGFRGGFRGRW